MAEKSYFFNDVNDDRVYLAEDFAMFFSTLIANGVFPNPSTNIQTLVNQETPMTITILPGKAWINGYLYWNPDNLVKTLEPAYANPRIDRIVVRWVSNIRDIKAYVVTGTPAAVPVAPELTRNSDVWELGIADIFVGGGVTSITQANITDTRLSNALCGIVHALVQQVDVTTLFNQYQAWISEKQTQFNSSLVEYAAEKQIEIDQLESDFQTDFMDFMTLIQGALSGDVAGNLLAKINENSSDISALQTFQMAEGISTAITLTGIQLTDGFQKTFIIASSNNGSATTINGKSLFKPGTTTAPKLIAGKAVTVWYNVAGDCFFIKASAEGTVTVEDVLAGKTFSNDDDMGLTGSMPNRGAVVITPNASNQTILSGYHNGNGYVAGDSDLIPANIKDGINIFGVIGTNRVNGIVKEFLATGSQITINDFVNYIESVPTPGTAKNIYSGVTYATQAIRLSTNSVLVLYSFASGTYAVVHTVSGTTITNGAAVSISSYGGFSGSLLNETSIIVTVQEGSILKAKVLLISGTTISVGAAYTIINASCENNQVVGLTDTGALVTYTNQNTWLSFAVILGINGTVINVNTAVQIRSPRISQQYSGLVKLSSTKILMHFTNFSDQKGTALIFTISGTAIAVGTECVFNSGTCYYITATVLASGNYVLIAYNDSDTTGLMSNRLHIFHPKDSCDNTFIRLINGGIF